MFSALILLQVVSLCLFHTVSRSRKQIITEYSSLKDETSALAVKPGDLQTQAVIRSRAQCTCVLASCAAVTARVRRTQIHHRTALRAEVPHGSHWAGPQASLKAPEKTPTSRLCPCVEVARDPWLRGPSSTSQWQRWLSPAHVASHRPFCFSPPLVRAPGPHGTHPDTPRSCPHRKASWSATSTPSATLIPLCRVVTGRCSPCPGSCRIPGEFRDGTRRSIK